ncbi:MAG: hypothetical protein QNI99_02695 [Woeseiaceae bacterium]|nr:hypothetical protein [Woeseiaceae bacterium]
MVLRFSDVDESQSYDDGFGDFVDGRRRPIFAESPAYNVLRRELKRYLGRDIRGRSFLVSGHRGSGKTTLVLRAIEDLQHEPIPTDREPQRPLLVKLHGPTILDPSIGAALPKAGQNGKVTPAAGNNGKNGQGAACGNTAAQAVLIQVTIALYRELSAEVARCYRRAIYRTAKRQGLRDAHEHVGQLCLELDNAPDPALLREFWARAGALRQGVFWDSIEDGEDSWYLDKGIRELIAISTAAQAYRVVSGSITDKTVNTGSAETERTSQQEVKRPMADFANPILSVLTGGLFGSAALVGQNANVFGAAGIGLATIFLTSLTLSWTTKRARKQSVSREHTFIRDRSVETLDRELPTVIERIRDAGLAPVFVVDELDKVDRLDEHMTGLVERLKHLVADRSFFCFLTDRDYFEDLREKSRVFAYPKEHTYFSHRLFVLYRPEDLQRYLQRLIRIEEPSESTSEIHRFALTKLLKHRAMMHTFDLQRELAKVSDDRGIVEITWKQLSNQLGYRYHMMIQMAIEFLLDEDELRERLEQDAQFGQLVYDALYMPSRRWFAGERELDVSGTAIEEYLLSRLDTLGHRGLIADTQAETKNVSSKSKDSDGGNEIQLTTREKLKGLVRDTDRKYLIRLVQKLAAMLDKPESLVTQISDWASQKPDSTEGELFLTLAQRIPISEDDADVPDAEPTKSALKDRRLIKGPKDQSHRYRWYRDPYGRRLLREGETEQQYIDKGVQASDSEFLDDVSAFFEDLGGDRLGFGSLEELGVVPSVPSWSYVEDAKARLAEYLESEREYKNIGEDQDALQEYVAMLRRNGAQVLQALAAAHLIGREAGLDHPHEQTWSGLQALSDLLDLSDPDRQQAQVRLREFVESQEIWIDAVPELSSESLSEWIDVCQQLRANIDDRPLTSIDDHRDAGWEEWTEQQRVYLHVGTHEPTRSLSRAACLAAGVGPGDWSLKSPERLTIREASGVLVDALLELGKDYAPRVPFMVVLPLIRHLGILGTRELVLEFFARLLEWDGTSGSARQAIKQTETKIDIWFASESDDQENGLMPSRAVGVILARMGDGMADDWLPSSEYGALRVEVRDLPAAEGAVVNPVLTLVLTAQPRVVMLDLHDTDPKEAEGLVSRGAIDFGNEVALLPTIYLSPYADELKEMYSRWHYFGGDGLDRAMTYAIEILEGGDGSNAQQQSQRESAKKQVAGKKPGRKKAAKKKATRKKAPKKKATKKATKRRPRKR